MSPELQEFYNSYQAWLDDGALHLRGQVRRQPYYAPHDRRYGLCYAIHSFTRFKAQYLDTVMPAYGLRRILCAELGDQLMNALGSDDGYPELNTMYPFGLPSQYEHEKRTATAHLNPHRIAWVKKHATNTKETEA